MQLHVSSAGTGAPAAGPRRRLLIANRGEIAIRIAQAAQESGITSVGIYAPQDRTCAHVGECDEAYEIPSKNLSTPVAPYLDIDAIIDLALQQRCHLIAPGYGFLSESAEFARRITERSPSASSPIRFVGPNPHVLELFGDKAKSRALAIREGVPVVPGSAGHCSLADCEAFVAQHGLPVMLKAVFGGGGKGMRIVRQASELSKSFAEARSEARAAFGRPEVFIERYLAQARHIEIQIVGDGQNLIALGERDCTLQQSHQKVLEIAPSPVLSAAIRQRMIAAALKLCKAAGVDSVTTVEFLLDLSSPPSSSSSESPSFYFMECNPRIQVEHTVTEEVCGVDLVKMMLQIAEGRRDVLSSPEMQQLSQSPSQRFSVQARITAVSPGKIQRYHAPGGNGCRVESGVYAGYEVSPSFDPLLMKVICTASTYAGALQKLHRALQTLVLDGDGSGFQSNVPFLLQLIADARVQRGEFTTAFIAENGEELRRKATAAASVAKSIKLQRSIADSSASSRSSSKKIDHTAHIPPLTSTQFSIASPLTAQLVSLSPLAVAHARVKKGDALATLSAMKMETSLRAERDGVIVGVHAKAGEVVQAGTILFVLDSAASSSSDDDTSSRASHRASTLLRQLDWSSELLHMRSRHRSAYAPGGPSKRGLERQKRAGKRTVRERIAMFVEREPGQTPAPVFEVGTQAGGMSKDGKTLTPANFLTLRSELQNGRPIVIGADDCTVLGGHSDGVVTAMKQMYAEEMCRTLRLPMVRLLDGSSGGGSVTALLSAGYNYLPPLPAFPASLRLLCEVPIVSLLLGAVVGLGAARAVTSHFSIGVRGLSQIFVAGPPIVEHATHETVTKEQLGGVAVHGPNGTVDQWVASEEEAMQHARRFLEFMPQSAWELAERSTRTVRMEEKPEELLSIVPRHRQTTYDMRRIIELIVDRYEETAASSASSSASSATSTSSTSSFFELGNSWALNILTGLARIRGYTVGILASDCRVLGGALDANGCEKVRRFLEMCQTFHIPIVNLCDMPGFAVGLATERASTIRRGGQMIGAFYALNVPMFTCVIRRSFGIAGAAFTDKKTPLEANMRVAWPSGDWGSLPLEGGVEAAFKGKLAALSPSEADQMKAQLLAQFEAIRSPLKTAEAFGIEEVIDPRETRDWLCSWIELAYKRMDQDGPKPRAGGYPL